MLVDHIDEFDANDVVSRRIGRRLAAVLGGIGLIALAAIPGAFAVLLLMRPDLFLER